MAFALFNLKTLLASLRKNDWYITAFPFSFFNKEYVIIFEDLREIDKGTKYYAVCLTFIDINDESRRFETYANAWEIREKDKTEILAFLGYVPKYKSGDSIWSLYEELNNAIPSEYSPLKGQYKEMVLSHIDKRENNEGFCCYSAKHNGIDSNGKQIYRSAKNTAKTKLQRPSLYESLGVRDKRISFCYRQTNELSDIEIILAFAKRET